jgi:DNA-binding transcriptional ArsR family regulator
MTKTEASRTITDSRVLAAMAHPLRRRLLDALKVDGPSTASMLANRTGQAIGNVSHHMKVLAQAALVEEAPQLARDRRERWWRLSDTSRRWSSTSFDDDPAAAAVADAAVRWVGTTTSPRSGLGGLRERQLTRRGQTLRSPSTRFCS